jgi:molybdenum cofactor cytidylyltransferase
MRLSESLRIREGETVAFVGAGGKSTAIHKLVTELTHQLPVVVTTTTKIALDQVSIAREHLILDSMSDLHSAFDSLQTFESILLTAQKDRNEPKWLGLEPALIENLIHTAHERGWVLLIEADGARRKSLKVPASYEPALPSRCDLVVPVVGLDAIGEKYTSSKIHRGEIMKRLLDLNEEDPITTDLVIEILTSSHGGLKNIPASSIVRVLLNKARTDRDLENGHRIAQGLIKNARIQSVILASVKEEVPVCESICRVGGVVLAAGASTRLDGLKQVMIFRGKPLVVHSVEAALEGDLKPVAVVVGEGGEAVRNALGHSPVQFVENRNPQRGQSSSVRLGLNAIQDQVDAVIFLLADMPLVTSDLVRTLVEKHRHTLGSVIAPFMKGMQGNPVLFDRETFNALQEVHGDQGGRAIFSRYPVLQVDWDDSVLFDVDSAEDLRKMREIE